MSEAIEQFFASLPARAPAVLRSPIGGTLQIDLTDGNRTEHWYVTMAPGSARVSRHEERPPDAVLTAGTQLFEGLVTGREAGMAAVLRNEATFGGQVVLFLALRRFLPDPPGVRDPRDAAREHVRQST
ncbi:SCP2 sterol-binding domain-containing protein [Micromonospora sp. WMMD1128]|uniref:SCP2 sterol-binding domain-containing protein n=1 Tax=unclassified Micromonospora TaxID=2617518 RepID=UPI00248BDE4D|nr:MULTISPECIES: SCP2 sterol-binding domain-containing protein [unclassified Micromonospora]WBB74240.1 SCP2 sterol-binding domain-containing protein [Micromonospora sp. WMMD1128]WFE32376.1 SCP2 sterol-binding domain-containing protein [Micromonospora sp. WMMD975]